MRSVRTGPDSHVYTRNQESLVGNQNSGSMLSNKGGTFFGDLTYPPGKQTIIFYAQTRPG